MHRKRIIKIINIVVIIIYLFSFSKLVFADEIDPLEVIGEGANPNKQVGLDSLYNLGNIILGIVQYIAVGVSVIALLILAMKYMYSSPGDKADIKKKLIPFIIGGVLVFGSVQLIKIIEVFAKNNIT